MLPTMNDRRPSGMYTSTASETRSRHTEGMDEHSAGSLYRRMYPVPDADTSGVAAIVDASLYMERGASKELESTRGQFSTLLPTSSFPMSYVTTPEPTLWKSSTVYKLMPSPSENQTPPATRGAPRERRIGEGKMVREVVAVGPPVELPELARRQKQTVKDVELCRVNGTRVSRVQHRPCQNLKQVALHPVAHVAHSVIESARAPMPTFSFPAPGPSL